MPYVVAVIVSIVLALWPSIEVFHWIWHSVGAGGSNWSWIAGIPAFAASVMTFCVVLTGLLLVSKWVTVRVPRT